MPCCLAAGCNNRTYNKSQTQDAMESEKKITFHRFPKNGQRRLKWAKIMSLNEKSLPKNVFLCSLHFSEDQFDRTSLMCVRLRDNAIPNQNISNIKDNDCSNQYTDLEVESNTSEESTNPNMVKAFMVIDDKVNIQKHDSHNLQILNVSSTQFESNDTLFNEHEQSSNINTINYEEITQMKKQKHSAQTSTAKMSSSGNSLNIPKKIHRTILHKTILKERNLYKRQIRSLQQKNRRQEKKIVALFSIINDLTALNSK